MLPYIALGNEAGMPRGAFRALLLLTNSARAGAHPGWRALLLLPAGPPALPAPSSFLCTVVFSFWFCFGWSHVPEVPRGWFAEIPNLAVGPLVGAVVAPTELSWALGTRWCVMGWGRV